MRVDDLSDDYLGSGEKQNLLDFFANLQKPPIVLIAHIAISEDLVHDNAFVQHFNSCRKSFGRGCACSRNWLLGRLFGNAPFAQTARQTNTNLQIKFSGFRSKGPIWTSTAVGDQHLRFGISSEERLTGRMTQIPNSATIRMLQIGGSCALEMER